VFAQLFTVFDRYRNTAKEIAGFGPSAAAQAREQILNYCASVTFTGGASEAGYESFREIRRALLEKRWPYKLASRLWRSVNDFDDVAKGVSRPQGEPYVGSVGTIQLYSRAEQAPNPDCCVSLGSERDALGLNKVRLDWRLTELDKRTIRIANRLIGEELGRLGLGRVQLPPWLLGEDNVWPANQEGGFHHMGTTRMADDPKQGVVDRHCRVHGLSNLYIAGSSVFPTGGYANPTLTLVALALRLADTLRKALRG
jgi:choline dehydrogenase-like flavoprotein